MTEWLYGDAWERFPIVAGEVWGVPPASQVAVHDLCQPLPAFMAQADLVFVDPPWNLGNLNTFYTKARRTDYHVSFANFADSLFRRLADMAPRACYIEIGQQQAEDFAGRLEALFPVLQRWPVTYYRKYPTWLLRGGSEPTGLDFTGIDEAHCIRIIAQQEPYAVLGDPCMGRGLVGLAAYQASKAFVGTELNPRRLACLLAGLSKIGAPVERLQPGPFSPAINRSGC